MSTILCSLFCNDSCLLTPNKKSCPFEFIESLPSHFQNDLQMDSGPLDTCMHVTPDCETQPFHSSVLLTSFGHAANC